MSFFLFQILTDLQARFIREMGKRAQSNAELANHSRTSVLDVQFAMDQLRIDISDLEMYLNHLKQCDGVLNRAAVPQFPAKSDTNLNFLKPGSREVLVRKMHVQDYFPPMYAEMEDDYHNTSVASGAGDATEPREDGATDDAKDTSLNSSLDQSHLGGSSQPVGEDNPVRDLASVMMTSSGFISPAIQGRTAEARFDRSDLEEGQLALLQAAKESAAGALYPQPEEPDVRRTETPKSSRKGGRPRKTPAEKKKPSKSSKVDPDFEPAVDDDVVPPEFRFEPPAKNSRKRKATKTPQIIEDDDDDDLDLDLLLEDDDEPVKKKKPTPEIKSPPAKKRGRPRKTPEKPEKAAKESKEVEKPVAPAASDTHLKAPLPITDDNLTLPPPPPHLLLGPTEPVATEIPEKIKKSKESKLDKAARKKEKERKKEERRKAKQKKKEERKKLKKLKLAKQKGKDGLGIVAVDPTPAPPKSLPTLKIKEPVQPPEKKPKKGDKKAKLSTKISLKSLLPKKKAKEASSPTGAKRGRKPKVKINLPPANEPKAPAVPSGGGGIVTTQTVCHYFDAEGNEIWICPVCGKQEEDMPMVGCDGKGPDGKGCDDWYHFICVGIEQMPETEDWFCPKCAPLS